VTDTEAGAPHGTASEPDDPHGRRTVARSHPGGVGRPGATRCSAWRRTLVQEAAVRSVQRQQNRCSSESRPPSLELNEVGPQGHSQRPLELTRCPVSARARARLSDVRLGECRFSFPVQRLCQPDQKLGGIGMGRRALPPQMLRPVQIAVQATARAPPASASNAVRPARQHRVVQGPADARIRPAQERTSLARPSRRRIRREGAGQHREALERTTEFSIPAVEDREPV